MQILKNLEAENNALRGRLNLMSDALRKKELELDVMAEAISAANSGVQSAAETLGDIADFVASAMPDCREDGCHVLGKTIGMIASSLGDIADAYGEAERIIAIGLRRLPDPQDN